MIPDSWVVSATSPEHPFPIQNLPYGVFRRGTSGAAIGVAIGDEVLSLHALAGAGFLDDLGQKVVAACRAPVLNELMALGPEAWGQLRVTLQSLLSGEIAPDVAAHLVPQRDVEMLMPVRVGDYSDFYASINHALNVGAMFRPDQPLMPNYKWVPIGYHGRASSLVVSGTPVRRPSGQVSADDSQPTVTPTRSLDYECEMGVLVGQGNPLGAPIAIGDASRHIFGYVLLNDWSARDIQRWEYQPLGPFLSKSFVTSISPWVVTSEALEPFRAPLRPRLAGDPAPLPYLSDAHDAKAGGIDVTLEVFLSTEAIRRSADPPIRLSVASFLEMYWTPAQLVTHQTSNGCNLQPGDLLGSGTISGTTPESRGCLLELTARGKSPVALPNGETRRFLEDGDEVILRGTCRREGAVTIGFGECRGRVQG
ncbi:MAG TPA: fumarylacetoacetase [Candidatus Polarisedimenticolia bacterium]|nr:fumarylacetoacetase [Candidatus Polarisedimenticolia bacterium]